MRISLLPGVATELTVVDIQSESMRSRMSNSHNRDQEDMHNINVSIRQTWNRTFGLKNPIKLIKLTF